MLLTALLSAFLFANSAAATPVQVDRSLITLSMTRRLNLTSAHNLVRHDQARANYLKNRAMTTSADRSVAQPGDNEPVDNQAVTYIATLGVGSPATNYSLIVDTGSSNTWIGANLTHGYVKTPSSSLLPGGVVTVTYGSGQFVGFEYNDTVTITSNLVIPKQSIGVAELASGFSGVDGILGIGPVDLTKGTLATDLSATIPTVTDNLFTSGQIDTETIGISFEPTTVDEVVNGVITWGGIDETKFTGDITYVPVTTTTPASSYWGIDQSIRYGQSTSILSTTAGIVDTGTTLILIATDGFNAYKAATGAIADTTTGLLSITPAQFADLQSLFFTIGGTNFELTPNAQLWPRSLNSAIGGTADKIYLIVGDIGSNSGAGLDFINGYGFLERFYSVYDTSSKHVGIATTPFTNAQSN